MHVVVFARHFPSISQTFVTQEVVQLAQRGVSVSVLANSSDWPDGQEIKTELIEYRVPVNYYNLPSSIFGRILSGFQILIEATLHGNLSVFKTLNFFKFGLNALNLSLLHVYSCAMNSPAIDILHCHFGPIGVLGGQLKKMGLVKNLFVTFHGYDLSKTVLGAAARRQYRQLFDDADFLLPVSMVGEKILKTLGAPPTKIRVHRMGVHIPTAKVRLCNEGKSQVRILTVARLTEKKGLPYAIEAVSRVVNSDDAVFFRYDIIGGGPLKKSLEDQIARLGLSEIVYLHGPRSSEEVIDFMRRSDIFILPSVTAKSGDKEGIPVSLMEAMAQGLPVISTLHGGIPELIQDSVSGFLVPERDVNGLADRICLVLNDPKLRRDMGSAAKAKVSKEYNSSKQFEELLEILGLKI